MKSIDNIGFGRFLVNVNGKGVAAQLVHKSSGFELLSDTGPIPSGAEVLAFLIEGPSAGTPPRRYFLGEVCERERPGKLTTGSSATLTWDSVWPFDEKPISLIAKLGSGSSTWSVTIPGKLRHFASTAFTELGGKPTDKTDLLLFLDGVNPDESLGLKWTTSWRFPSAPSSEDSFVKHLLRPSWKTFDYGLLGYSQSCCALLPIADRELPLWGGALPLLNGPSFDHSDEIFGAAPDYFRCPVLFFRRTIPDIQTSRREPWRAIFQSWFPERDDKSTAPGHGIPAIPLFLKLWNKVQDERAVARGAALPGTPFCFLPRIKPRTTDDKKDFNSSFEWLFSFRREANNWIADLDHARMQVRPGTNLADVNEIELSFALTDITGNSNPLVLSVRPAVNEISSAWSSPTLGFKGPAEVEQVIESATALSDESLIEAKFEVSGILRAPDKPVRMGSVEIQFQQAKPQPGAKINLGSVTMRLHGTWSSVADPDLAPEVDLKDLPCIVNTMGGQDASREENNVVLNASDADPFIRQAFVEGDAFSIGESNTFQAALDIREKHGLERNPVVHLVINRIGNAEELKRHVSLQFRPFAVAAVETQSYSPEANEVLAQWRSDDPEGAQWRWGIDEITVSLPPSVGEEMERGARFWRKPSGAAPSTGLVPYIDPTQPIKHRFTTPSVLVVTPGEKARRYHRSAQNLDWVLADAEVKGFRAEVMYPVLARFERDREGMPRIRVREAAARFGAVPEPLSSQVSFGRRLNAYFGVAWHSKSDVERSRHKYADLRRRHAITAYNYRSRLAQYELYDHYRPDALGLDRNLKFAIRPSKNAKDAPAPSLEPLPLAMPNTEPLPKDWEWAQETNGGIRAGVLHTVEFPSELNAILRTPRSDRGTIDSLSFSAFGANSTASVSFDEGRTQFSVTMQDGQAHRVVKTRIGRIGVLWNRAKHVIVYDRTVMPSEQFEEEQAYPQGNKKNHPFDGWPLLRKTQEYIELLEPLRRFGEEVEAKGDNRAGCIDGSEFFSKRILVNGVWGRDLRTGYEIPLWNPQADPGIYVKPKITLRGQVDAEVFAYLDLTDPSQLYFYTNTEVGKGADSDKWAAALGVDFLNLPRPPVGDNREGNDILVPRLSAASPIQFGWDRFNLAVDGDPVDVVAGRSEKPVYVRPQRALLMRSSQSGPGTQPITGIEEATKVTSAVAKARPDDPTGLPAAISDPVAAFRSMVESAMRSELSKFNGNCGALTSALKAAVSAAKISAEQELDAQWNGALFAIGKVEQDFLNIETEVGKAIDNATHAWMQPAEAVLAAQKALQDQIRKALEEVGNLDIDALKQLHQLALDEHDRLFGVVQSTFDKTLLDPLNTWLGDWKNRAREMADTVKTGVKGGVVLADLRRVRAALETLKSQLPGLLQDSARARLPSRIADLIVGAQAAVVDLINTVIKYCDEATGKLNPGAAGQQMLDAAEGLVTKADKAIQLVVKLKSETADFISKAAKGASDRLEEFRKLIEAQTPDPAAIRKKLDEFVGFFAKQDWGAGWLSVQKEVYEAEIKKASNALSNALKEDGVNGALGTLYQATGFSRMVVSEVHKAALAGLIQAETIVTKGIDDIGSDCDRVSDAVRKALGEAEDEVRRQVRDVEAKAGRAIHEVVNSELGQRLQQVYAGISDEIDKGSKYVKLAKLIGSPPELPTLTFNRDRIEYVFSDAKKEIETSPMAARLRELSDTLNELGLQVPTKKLLEHFIPDKLEGIDVNKIFKDIGGLRFDNLFGGMKLPNIGDDKIKITHDVDVRARTAWVKATTDVQFDKELTAFGGPVPLKVGNARFQAEVKLDTGPSGTKSTSYGRMKGDWSLTLGSDRLCTFRDVSVIYTSDKGLEFDISMDRVELHPVVQFVSEYARALEKKLPPGLELVKKDGKPVGVKASVTSRVPGFNTGFFGVGPFILGSGFSLLLKPDGAPQGVEIRTDIAVGSRKLPFNLQIGWLSGAAWLTASATQKVNGRLSPSASVGFAAGIGRSLTVASVAHASFSFLFFVNSAADDYGSMFECGIRIHGEARLLGFVSASILLELVARNQNGETKGYGTLDVEVEICWCYTLHVVRGVEQGV